MRTGSICAIWFLAGASAGFTGGAIWTKPEAFQQETFQEKTPLEIMQSSVQDCATLGRTIRAMAAETVEADYLSDVEAKNAKASRR